MKVKIQIDTQTFVRFWLVVIGFAFVILGLYLARTALVILAVSAFLAIALNAPVSYLSKLIPGKSRVGATALAYVIVVSLLAGVVFLVIPPIVNQTSGFIGKLPQTLNQLSTQWDGVGAFVQKYNLQPQLDEAVQSFKTDTTQWVTNFTKNIASSLTSMFSALAALILILVMSFLMLLDGPRFMDAMWGLYRDKNLMKEHRKLADKMVKVVSGYVNGQLTISGVGALFAGLTVFILSFFIPEINASLSMPVIAITFVFTLIPMFGSTIAGALSSILLALTSVPAGVIFVIYFIIYQQIENNFIAPAIQARYIQLSALTVLIAATVGLYMMGILGGIVAIPIAGCIKILMEHYISRSEKEKNQSVAQKILKKVKN